MKKTLLLITTILILASCSKDDDLPSECITVENNGVFYQIDLPTNNYGHPSREDFIESFSRLSTEAARQFEIDSPCD